MSEYKYTMYILLIATIMLSPCARAEKSLMREINKYVFKHTEETINKKIPFDECSHLTVQVEDGSVTIEEWSNNYVQMKATKFGSQNVIANTAIAPQKQGQQCIIKVIPTNTNESIAHTDYSLLIPRGINLTVSIDTGAATIKKKGGRQQITVQKGFIDWQGASADLNLKTYSGNIDCNIQEQALNSSVRIASGGYLNLRIPELYMTDIEAKSEQGTITSAVPITIAPFTTRLDKNSWNKFKKETRGFINRQGKGFMQLHAYRSITIDKNNIPSGTDNEIE